MGQRRRSWTPLGTGITTFPYPYIHIARFSESTKALIDEPIIWAPNAAYAYGSIAADARGHLGLAAMYAGASFYPSSVVFVRDDITSTTWAGIGVRAGTNGPSTNQWGDYSTRAPPSRAGLYGSGGSATIRRWVRRRR